MCDDDGVRAARANDVSDAISFASPLRSLRICKQEYRHVCVVFQKNNYVMCVCDATQNIILSNITAIAGICCKYKRKVIKSLSWCARVQTILM